MSETLKKGNGFRLSADYEYFIAKDSTGDKRISVRFDKLEEISYGTYYHFYKDGEKVGEIEDKREVFITANDGAIKYYGQASSYLLTALRDLNDGKFDEEV